MDTGRDILLKLRLGRCRVGISFYFFALLALAGAYGGDIMLCGIAAAAIHECGHIAAVCVCTGSAVPVYFDITPFGMKMGVIPAGLDSRRELAILSGGIVANTVTALAFLALGQLTGRGAFTLHALAGLCVAAVNAVTALPLDGGKIMRVLLARRMEQRRADEICFAVSLVSLFLMSLAGFFVLLRSRGNFSLLALALWLLAKCLTGEENG